MLPLGVTMLWEQVDARVALEERFGFDSWDAVQGWVTATLGERWNLAVRRCLRIVISGDNAIAWVRGGGGDLIVKWSRAHERFATLGATTGLLRVLAAHEVPVAVPVATVDGFDRVIEAGPLGPLSVTVLPELPGDWLDIQDPVAVRSAGACLARVHRALSQSRVDHSSIPVSSGSLRERVESWLSHGDRGRAPVASRLLRTLVSEAPALDDEPQLVHNDFRAANVLTRGSVVVGVLDLDDAVVDHRVNDLAKAGTYLGTRFTDWRPTPRTVRRLLRDGYESVRPLSPVEARWFEVLELWQGVLAVPDSGDKAGWVPSL